MTEGEEIKRLLEENNIGILRYEYDRFGKIRMINCYQQTNYNQQFTLLVTSTSNEIQWRIAKRNAYQLSQCKKFKENIVNFEKDFYLGSYYFVQIELQVCTLDYWRDKNREKDISSYQFSFIALELFNFIKYLQRSYGVIPDFNLENILIQKKNTFKISSVLIQQTYNLPDLKKTYEYCIENKKLFYYPLSFLEKKAEDGSEEVQFGRDIGVYQLGIILYAISGASNEQIMNFLLGKEKFRIQYELDSHINSFIAYMLLVESNENKLMITDIQSSFTEYNYQFVFSQQELRELGVYYPVYDDDDDEEDDDNEKDEKDEEDERLKKEHQIVINNNKNQEIFMDHFVRGIRSFYENKLELSLYCMKKCIEIYSSNEICHYQIALIYQKQNKPNLCISSLEEVIGINTDNQLATCLLGEMHEKINNLKQAKKYYKQSTPTNVWYKRPMILLCLLDTKIQLQGNKNQDDIMKALPDLDTLERQLRKDTINDKDYGDSQEVYHLGSIKFLKRMIEILNPTYESLELFFNTYNTINYYQECKIFVRKMMNIDTDNLCNTYCILNFLFKNEEKTLQHSIICSKKFFNNARRTQIGICNLKIQYSIMIDRISRTNKYENLLKYCLAYFQIQKQTDNDISRLYTSAKSLI